MKKYTISLLIWSLASSLAADPSFHPSGANLTSGSMSFGNTLISETNNPATPAWSMQQRRFPFAFSLVSSIGAGVEIGQVDNFIDDLDRLADELDKNNLRFEEANNIINEFQSVLVQMGDVGYVTAGVSAHVPLFPLAVRTMGGSLMLDVTVSGQGRMTILDSPIQFNSQTGTLETNTALYLKAATVSEASLGYSRQLADLGLGKLYSGLRAKYYKVGLNKSVISISDTDGDANNAIEDRVGDFTESTGVGIDFGLMLMSNHYSLGATILNINQPKFEYNTIGLQCNQYSSSSQMADCQTAFSYSNEIDLQETHVFNSQFKVDAALFTTNKRWALMSSMDMNAVNDPVGNQVQWLVTSVGYLATGRWLPGIRAGYRKNLTGSQLTYATGGVSLFRIINFDVAYGLDKVVIDGNIIPRGVAFNLGVDFGF